MNIHAIVCTRSTKEVTHTTDKLLSYLVSCGIQICLIGGSSSIYRAYHGAYYKINPDPEDIIIFCHDDIEIREEPSVFVEKLMKRLKDPETGFVGPAGTTHLGETAIWWDLELWKQGKHRGKVLHLTPEGKEYLTPYGPPDDVVVLDGLFLAAKPKVIEDIGLEKPEYFKGEWDFYDIHYTSQAFLKGYSNRILDLNILHNSRGELVGRDSWHMNREAFIEKNDLPIKILD